MKEFDKFGMALCRSEYEGHQCEGHEGHGVEHFISFTDGAMTWTDENVVKQYTQEQILALANGKCCI